MESTLKYAKGRTQRLVGIQNVMLTAQRGPKRESYIETDVKLVMDRPKVNPINYKGAVI